MQPPLLTSAWREKQSPDDTLRNAINGHQAFRDIVGSQAYHQCLADIRGELDQRGILNPNIDLRFTFQDNGVWVFCQELQNVTGNGWRPVDPQKRDNSIVANSKQIVDLAYRVREAAAPALASASSAASRPGVSATTPLPPRAPAGLPPVDLRLVEENARLRERVHALELAQRDGEIQRLTQMNEQLRIQCERSEAVARQQLERLNTQQTAMLESAAKAGAVEERLRLQDRLHESQEARIAELKDTLSLRERVGYLEARNEMASGRNDDQLAQLEQANAELSSELEATQQLNDQLGQRIRKQKAQLAQLQAQAKAAFSEAELDALRASSREEQEQNAARISQLVAAIDVHETDYLEFAVEKSQLERAKRELEAQLAETTAQMDELRARNEQQAGTLYENRDIGSFQNRDRRLRREKGALQQQVSNQKQLIEGLASTLERISNENSSQNALIEELKQDLSAYRMQLARLEAELREARQAPSSNFGLRKQLLQVQGEYAQYKEKADQLIERMEVILKAEAAQIATAESQNATLTVLAKRSQQQLQQAQREIETYKEKNEQLAAQAEQFKAGALEQAKLLQQSVDSSIRHAAETSHLPGKIHEAEEANAKHEQIIRDITAELAQLKANAETQQSNLAAKQAELEAAQAAERSSKAEAERLRTELAELEKTHSAKTAEAQQLSEKLEAAEQASQQHSKQVEDLTRQLETEANRLSAELDELKRTNDSKAQQLSEKLKEAERKSQQNSDQVQSLQSQLQEAQAQAESAQQEHIAALQAKEVQLAAAVAAQKNFELQAEQLSTQLEELKRTNDSKAQQLSEKLKAAERKSQQNSDQVQSLQSQLEAAQAEAERAGLAHGAELREKESQLSAAREDQEKNQAALAELQKQHSQELLSKAEEVQELSSTLQPATQALQEKTQRVEELQRHLLEATAQAERSQAQVQQLQAQVADLTRTHSSQKEEAQRLSQRLQAAEQASEESLQRVQDLESQYQAQAERARHEHNSAIQAKTAELAEAVAVQATSQAQVQELRTQLKEFETTKAKNAELETELNSANLKLQQQVLDVEALRQNHQQELAEQRTQIEQAVRAERQIQQLAEMPKAHGSVKAIADLTNELRDTQTKHATILEDMQAQHKQRIEEIEQAFSQEKQQQAEELQALREKLSSEKAEAKRKAQSHQSELDHLQTAHDLEMESLRSEKSAQASSAKVQDFNRTVELEQRLQSENAKLADKVAQLTRQLEEGAKKLDQAKIEQSSLAANATTIDKLQFDNVQLRAQIADTQAALDSINRTIGYTSKVPRTIAKNVEEFANKNRELARKIKKCIHTSRRIIPNQSADIQEAGPEPQYNSIIDRFRSVKNIPRCLMGILLKLSPEDRNELILELQINTDLDPYIDEEAVTDEQILEKLGAFLESGKPVELYSDHIESDEALDPRYGDFADFVRVDELDRNLHEVLGEGYSVVYDPNNNHDDSGPPAELGNDDSHY